MKEREKSPYLNYTISKASFLLSKIFHLKSIFGVDAFTLKIIAIIAMTIDHVGVLLYPDALWLRVIGRLAIPIMAFLVVEGYHKTSNLKRYLLRLLIFAMITQPIYRLAFPHGLNILFDLLGGLCLIWLADRIRLPWVTYLLVVMTSLIGIAIELDWWHLGLLLIFVFHKTRGRFEYTLLILSALLVVNFFVFAIVSSINGDDSYLIINAINLGSILALPILFLYNGSRGFDYRYFFYAYYPLHLLILCEVRQLLL